MSKIFLTFFSLVLVASACGVDRSSSDTLNAEEETTTTDSIEDAGGDVADDESALPTSTVPPLQPSEPPVTAPAGEVAIDVDFGDEQWQLTHGELNDVVLSVWESEDFIRRAFGGQVPPGFYSTVAGEQLVGKVLDRLLADVDSETSEAELEAARGSLMELVVSWFGDSADPQAEAEALFDDVPYLGFVAELQADQQVLIEAIAGDGSSAVEVPCVSHILVEEEAAAQDVLAELEGGADFAQLAVERSTGPSGPSGGELGCASSSNYVPEFAEAVDNAELGQPVGPVQTQFGWHVLVVTGVEEQPVDPTVELNNRISDELSGATVEVDPIIGAWDDVALRITEAPTASE